MKQVRILLLQDFYREYVVLVRGQGSWRLRLVYHNHVVMLVSQGVVA
jgi:uncharacterized protein YegP (UPF0339 family)